MKMKPYAIQSIRELHHLLDLPKPGHPLISVIDFSKIRCFDDKKLEAVSYGFYCIAMKKNFKGTMRYGQQHYDFDDGIMTFFAPHQVVITAIRDDWQLEGLWLVVHPDFIKGFALGKDIHQFGYFSYAVNEALHVSGQEEQTITRLLEDISKEIQASTDSLSQPILIKQIELLLTYCDRFYRRQFLTRKQADTTVLSRFETLVETYFEQNMTITLGLPTVAYFAGKLNLSRNYLSDMLRNTTGQSAQQHIGQKLLEKAKERLSFSDLTVSEIAYELGFANPQSFHKLFKSKTKLSPLAYRANFHSFTRPGS